MLARTWGLFGGALDAPKALSSATTPATPSTVARTMGTSTEKAAGGEGRSGEQHQRTPPLQVSIPVRAMPPHVLGLGNHHHLPAASDPEEAMGERTPPPVALAVAAGGGGDDDDGALSDDGGSRSPELTMLFEDEPCERGGEQGVAVAGDAGGEGLEGDPQASR